MNIFGFKMFSVKIVLYFRDVPNIHVAINVICAVCLFRCYKMSCPVYVVGVPAQVKQC